MIRGVALEVTDPDTSQSRAVQRIRVKTRPEA
jgi:hypothetical protein